MNRRQRAFSYSTNHSRLLVFTHTDFPEAGIQVPAGTVEHKEEPAAAVLREAEEETGLTDLTLIRCLGTLEHDMAEYGTPEIQEAWFCHLRALMSLLNRGGTMRRQAERFRLSDLISSGQPYPMACLS